MIAKNTVSYSISNNIYNSNISNNITLLDTKETSVSIEHSQFITDLRTNGYTELASKLEQCRTLDGYAVCNECNTAFEVKKKCKDRNCPVCAKDHQIKYSQKLLPFVQSFKEAEDFRYRLLTLTFPNVLKEQFNYEYVQNCRKSWKAFLQKLSRGIETPNGKLKLKIAKGIIATEVTTHSVGSPKIDKRTKKQIGVYTEADAGYHLHFHILFASNRFIPQKSLVKAWSEVLKLPTAIVDIRELKYHKGALKGQPKSGFSALNYVLDYHTKNTEHIGIHERMHVYNVMKSRRLIEKFGTKRAELTVVVKHLPFCPVCASVGKMSHDFHYCKEKPNISEVSKLRLNTIKCDASEFLKHRKEANYLGKKYSQNPKYIQDPKVVMEESMQEQTGNQKIEMLKFIENSNNGEIVYYDDIINKFGETSVSILSYLVLTGDVYSPLPDYFKVLK